MDRMTKAELVEFGKKTRESLRLAKQHLVARDGIIEGNHATMVLQNLYLNKQAVVLHAKENKKKADRTVLPMDGKGRHLTDEQWIQLSEQVENEKKKKNEEKSARTALRANNKAARLAAAAEWKEITRQHELDVQA